MLRLVNAACSSIAVGSCSTCSRIICSLIFAGQVVISIPSRKGVWRIGMLKGRHSTLSSSQNITLLLLLLLLKPLHLLQLLQRELQR